MDKQITYKTFNERNRYMNEKHFYFRDDYMGTGVGVYSLGGMLDKLPDKVLWEDNFYDIVNKYIESYERLKAQYPDSIGSPGLGQRLNGFRNKLAEEESNT